MEAAGLDSSWPGPTAGKAAEITTKAALDHHNSPLRLNTTQVQQTHVISQNEVLNLCWLVLYKLVTPPPALPPPHPLPSVSCFESCLIFCSAIDM